jgi:hypothetical protein
MASGNRALPSIWASAIGLPLAVRAVTGHAPSAPHRMTTLEAAIVDARHAALEFDDAQEWLNHARRETMEPLAAEVWVTDPAFSHVLLVFSPRSAAASAHTCAGWRQGTRPECAEACRQPAVR